VRIKIQLLNDWCKKRLHVRVCIYIYSFIYAQYVRTYIHRYIHEYGKNQSRVITKGSSSGATLSFALRSKKEGGQPRYLIIQEIASHFSTTPASMPPTHPKSRLKTL
jgi:hypothetical protein